MAEIWEEWVDYMAEIWEEWVCVAYGERMGVWVREYRALKNISRRYKGRMGV